MSICILKDGWQRGAVRELGYLGVTGARRTPRPGVFISWARSLAGLLMGTWPLSLAAGKGEPQGTRRVMPEGTPWGPQSCRAPSHPAPRPGTSPKGKFCHWW